MLLRKVGTRSPYQGYAQVSPGETELFWACIKAYDEPEESQRIMEHLDKALKVGAPALIPSHATQPIPP